jgi:type IV secretory pathway ATPase VirB11/archaellum biosynthesis ATPase
MILVIHLSFILRVVVNGDPVTVQVSIFDKIVEHSQNTDKLLVRIARVSGIRSDFPNPIRATNILVNDLHKVRVNRPLTFVADNRRNIAGSFQVAAYG